MRSDIRQGKGSQEVNKLNSELPIQSVQKPNEGMIYLNPSAKDGMNYQQARHCSSVPKPRGGIGCVENDPYPPPAPHYSVGCLTQFFPPFFLELS